MCHRIATRQVTFPVDPLSTLIAIIYPPTSTKLFKFYNYIVYDASLLWFILFWSLYLRFTTIRRPRLAHMTSTTSLSIDQQRRFNDLLHATLPPFATPPRRTMIPPGPNIASTARPARRKGGSKSKKSTTRQKTKRRHASQSVPPEPMDSTLSSPQANSVNSILALCFHTPSSAAPIAPINPLTTPLLRMALQAPSRFRNAATVSPKDPFSPPQRIPIIWDSGASVSITPIKSDFANLEPPSRTIQLRGIARHLTIEGQGTVAWSLHDASGSLRTLLLPAYYVPSIKVRLLSTTSLLQTYPNESIQVLANRLILSGLKSDPTRGTITAFVNPHTNLPTSEAYNVKETRTAMAALNATINEVHNANYTIDLDILDSVKYNSFFAPARSATPKSRADSTAQHTNSQRYLAVLRASTENSTVALHPVLSPPL
jgi:hypothetical protein